MIPVTDFENFSAFTEYVTTLSATSSTKAVVLENLRNYLYKTIKITPATAGKYTKISKHRLHACCPHFIVRKDPI